MIMYLPFAANFSNRLLVVLHVQVWHNLDSSPVFYFFLKKNVARVMAERFGRPLPVHIIKQKQLERGD